MKRIALLILLCLIATQAEARKLRVRHTQAESSWAITNPAFIVPSFQATEQPRRSSRVSEAPAQIIPHPSGCPRWAFCGCGASIAVFGRNVRDLWLAANWFKFPKAAAASGMVAVRNHHVFVLKSQTSRGTWIVEDYNSGGGLSRIHERSIAGYTIVNPHGRG